MRKPKPDKSRVYDSMGAVVASEGISLATMQRAKRAGCTAFRAGRVYIGELRAWIAANATKLTEMGDGSLKDQKIGLEIRKLTRIENAADKLLVKKADVAAAIRNALAKVAGISEAKLVHQYPISVAGMDPEQARVFGRLLHDSLMSECAKLSNQFPE